MIGFSSEIFNKTYSKADLLLFKYEIAKSHQDWGGEWGDFFFFRQNAPCAKTCEIFISVSGDFSSVLRVGGFEEYKIKKKMHTLNRWYGFPKRQHFRVHFNALGVSNSWLDYLKIWVYGNSGSKILTWENFNDIHYKRNFMFLDACVCYLIHKYFWYIIC